MKTSFMQAVDQYAGQLLCGLFSLFYARRSAPPARVKNIVIIKMFGIGSIILMTPLIRAIRGRYGQVHIAFVTLGGNEAVPPLYGITDHVFAIRRKSLAQFLGDTVKTLRELRRTRQDLVLDAEFFSRYTTLFSFFIKADFRIGFYNRDLYRGDLLDFHVYFNPYRHMKENFLELSAPLLPPEKDMALSSPRLEPRVFDRVRRALADAGLDPAKPVILMNPNVSDTSPAIDRSWPLENFVRLAEHLKARGFSIVFIGGPEDRPRTAKAARDVKGGAVDLSGKMGIDEFLALMRMAFMIVTNDSGPLHMAVSVQCPSYSFFGTESPVIFGHDSGLNRVFYLNLACSPCLSVFNHKRGRCEFNSRCIREIPLKTVTDRFEEDLPELSRDFERRSAAATV